MRIINGCLSLDTHFPQNKFSLENWTAYMESLVPNGSRLCLSEIEPYDFTAQCLPIIQYTLDHPEKVSQVLQVFGTVTKGLDEKIHQIFHRSLDTDLVLYLGLCNGAGWVTEINGRCTVLMGIEKIIELDWYSEQDMYGLIYHELGHVYQYQYGILERPGLAEADSFLWQLYIEGIAMYFEQKLMGDFSFYHQDKDDWKPYLDTHLPELKADFSRDLSIMTQQTQPYFGDWVRWQGRGDAGYYLGARFAQFLMADRDFNQTLSLDLAELRKCFQAFLLS